MFNIQEKNLTNINKKAFMLVKISLDLVSNLKQWKIIIVEILMVIMMEKKASINKKFIIKKLN